VHIIETPALQFLKGRPVAPIPGEEAARLATRGGCDADGVDYGARDPPFGEVAGDEIADKPPPAMIIVE